MLVPVLTRRFVVAFALLAALGGIGYSSTTSAARSLPADVGEAVLPTNPDDPRAPQTVYLVRSPDALPVVLMSARTSLNGSGDFSAAAADVVVVGPAVKELVAGSRHAEALQASLEAGVRVVACRLALQTMNVPSGDLMDGVDIVENGFHEMLRLQAAGYVSLQL